MEKAVSIGKASATGSLQLFIGKIASTIVLAIGSIIVGLYISESDYGLYTIALVPAATLLLFQDWGVGSALIKYCASYRASKKEGELRSLIVSGLTFAFLTGLGLTIFLLVVSNLVAVNVYGKPESGYLITLTSLTIIATAIYSCSLSIITGFERMGLSSIITIVSAIVQGTLSPLLVYLGFGAFGAVIGYTLATVAAAATSTLLLYFAVFSRLPQHSVSRKEIFQGLKPLLKYGIPISIASIVAGISTEIYKFIMASSTDIAIIGNYGIAINFAVFLTFFVHPIQTVLFPAFSKLDSVRDKQLLKTIYASSVKYSSLFLVPATIAIMVLASELVGTIYGNKWLSAPLFLSLYVAGNLVILLGNLSYNRLLFAMGETKTLLKLSVLILGIGVPLAFVLIPSWGIIGLILCSLIANISSLLVGIYWTWKHYEVKPDFKNSARILVSSVIAGLITIVFLVFFSAASWIMLTIGCSLFLTSYLLLIPLFGAVNSSDLNTLRLLFSDIVIVSKIFGVILKIVELPLNLKNRLNKKRFKSA